MSVKTRSIIVGVVLGLVVAAIMLGAISALISSVRKQTTEIVMATVEATLQASDSADSPDDEPDIVVEEPTVTPTSAPESEGSDVTPTPTSDAVPAVVISEDYDLNLRSEPFKGVNIIAELPYGTNLEIVGRIEDGTWLQVIAPDGTQGWVDRRFVQISGDVDRLPVTADPAAIATLQEEAVEEGSPSGSRYPYVSNITSTASQIFQNGQSLGNRPNIFSKVGDSITDTTQFLDPIGTAQYNLGDYQYLQPVIDYYSAEIALDRNSYANTSLAAVAGWAARNVLEPVSADHDYCLPDETPLVCEYRIVQPSVSLIMIGTNDVGRTSTGPYENQMREIIETSINMGVIPVVSTLPPYLASGSGDTSAPYNEVIRRLTQEYGVPLWDYHAAMQDLPNQGMNADGKHPSAANSGDFTGDNLQYGMTIRNLTALQALDAIWRQVIG